MLRRLTLTLPCLVALLLGQPVDAAPSQVHLGLPTSDPATALSVIWVESAPVANASVILTGPSGTRTIPAVRVPGPDVVYEAVLAPLVPGTAYLYQVGGKEFEFTAPPRSFAGDSAVTIVALGDHGVKPTSRATVEAIAELDPDLVLHAGDLAYARGSKEAWRVWFEQIAPVASRVPWMTAFGNHEVDTETDLEVYFQRLSLPGNERWYSFDLAGVHVIALDTYSRPFDETREEQIAWLRADLAANRDAAWTIAFLHAPPYSSFRHGSQEEVLTHFVPVLEAGGVDLVITAHDHAYERTHPLRNGTVVTTNATAREGNGTVYLVTGGGGQSLYDPDVHPAPDWSAARAKAFHVVALTANASAIEGRVVTTDGSGFEDRFRIEKPPKPKPDPTNPTPTSTWEPRPTPTTWQQRSPVEDAVETPGIDAAIPAAVLAVAALLLRRR